MQAVVDSAQRWLPLPLRLWEACPADWEYAPQPRIYFTCLNWWVEHTGEVTLKELYQQIHRWVHEDATHSNARCAGQNISSVEKSPFFREENVQVEEAQDDHGTYSQSGSGTFTAHISLSVIVRHVWVAPAWEKGSRKPGSQQQLRYWSVWWWKEGSGANLLRHRSCLQSKCLSCCSKGFLFCICSLELRDDQSGRNNRNVKMKQV